MFHSVRHRRCRSRAAHGSPFRGHWCRHRAVARGSGAPRGLLRASAPSVGPRSRMPAAGSAVAEGHRPVVGGRDEVDRRPASGCPERPSASPSARSSWARSNPSIREWSPMYIDGAYCACRVPIRSSTFGIEPFAALEQELPGEHRSVQLRLGEDPLPCAHPLRLFRRRREAGVPAFRQGRGVQRRLVGRCAPAERRCSVAADRRGARPHRARDLDPDAARRRRFRARAECHDRPRDAGGGKQGEDNPENAFLARGRLAQGCVDPRPMSFERHPSDYRSGPEQGASTKCRDCRRGFPPFGGRRWTPLEAACTAALPVRTSFDGQAGIATARYPRKGEGKTHAYVGALSRFC